MFNDKQPIQNNNDLYLKIKVVIYHLETKIGIKYQLTISTKVNSLINCWKWSLLLVI